MEKPKPYQFEEEIRLAVSGWASELRKPQQADIGEMTVPLVIGQSIAGLFPLESEVLQEFVNKLYSILQARVFSVPFPEVVVQDGLAMFGERFYELYQPWCSLVSDYGPTGVLAQATDHIPNSMLRFPAKTSISIWPLRVMLYRGYGSPTMQAFRLVKGES